MTKQLTGYSAARRELAHRIVTLSNRSLRTKDQIREIEETLERCKQDLRADQELLDGYQRILEITPAEEEAES